MKKLLSLFLAGVLCCGIVLAAPSVSGTDAPPTAGSSTSAPAEEPDAPLLPRDVQLPKGDLG